MEFKPTEEAELRKHQQRVDEWLKPNDRLNVLDNEMYLAGVNPDGSNRANLPSIDNLHEQDVDEYAELSLKQLCEISVDAELHNDRTTMSTVDDYILDKIDNMNLDDDYAERDGTIRDVAKKDKNIVSINQKGRDDGKTELKSELDNVYDRVIKLREDIKRNKLLENPSNVGELKNDQQKNLANAWENQTGNKIEWKSAKKRAKKSAQAENNDSREMLALLPGPEKSSSNSEDDEIIVLPEIKLNDDNADILDLSDDEIRTSAAASDLDVTPENEKKSKRKIAKWLALGAVSIASIFGVGAIIANQDDNNSNETPTEEAPDPGVDFSSAADVFEEETSTTEVAPETTTPEAAAEGEISSTNDAEVRDELTSAVIANLSAEDRAQIAGDSSKVVVSGDVMPSTNAVNAGVANPVKAMQIALDTFNWERGTAFVFGEGDMFWNGDKVMNDKQLEGYNQIFEQLIDKAS